MRRRTLIPIVILLSFAFNIGFALLTTTGTSDINWPFADLGPAVIQDSFYMRAPGLESPFGMIGDVPGGYSLYIGNPLQTGPAESTTTFLEVQTLNTGTIVLALSFAVLPLLVIIVLGRRSYGSTKTQ